MTLPAPALNAPPQPAAPLIQVRLPLSPPRMVYVFLGLIGLAFAGQLLSEQLLGVDVVAYYGAKINELIAAGQLWRLVTPIFVHGGWIHAGFNAYALYVLGRQFESLYGPWRFTLVFLLAGMAGSVCSLWFTPEASVGASGAIFGLIGAEAVFLYRNRGIFGARGRSQLQNLIFIAIINLAWGLQGSIDNWAHLGGLLGGLVLGWSIGPVWKLIREPILGVPPRLEDQQPLTAVRWLMVLGFAAALLCLTAMAVLFHLA